MKTVILIKCAFILSVVLVNVGCQKDDASILKNSIKGSVQMAQTGVNVISGQWDGDMDSPGINCNPGSICYIEIIAGAATSYDPGIYVGDPVTGKTRFMADEEVVGLTINPDGSTTTRHSGDLSVAVILPESIDEINNNL